MALARIITHSDLCARELAFHLLGRGYAVEIVSPDSVPDNPVDLELRVDDGAGDVLVASVVANEGKRTASLEFVHRVKAPVEEIILTPAVVRDMRVSEETPPANVVTSIVGAEEAEPAHSTALTVLAPEETSLDPESTSVETTTANTGSVSTIEGEKSGEPIGYFARQTSSIASPFAGPAVVLPIWEPQLIDRTVGWKSMAPAALTLALLVLLALFLAFGLRPAAKAWTGRAAPVPAVAAPTSANAPSPVAENVEPIAKPSAANHDRPHISTRHTEDPIAPDTVTYLDDRYKPASKSKSIQATASPIKHATGDIAADAATYLNGAPFSKPVK
ncbi:MAG: hypothetical protein ABSG02_20505 [Terriglobales bacterium]